MAFILPMLWSASAATASEPGSGVYATDCANTATVYRVNIRSDGEGEVQFGETTFLELLTSYSYYGVRTPSDFHVAVMFNREGSPLAPGEDGDPRIEIWKGEVAFYALLNGERDRRLTYCGELGSPGAVAEMPYSTELYDVIGYLKCSVRGGEMALSCPFGFLRGEGGSASLNLRTPFGSERILDLSDGEFSDLSGSQVEVDREGDDWLLLIDDEAYRIPDEVIVGG